VGYIYKIKVYQCRIFCRFW